MQLATPLIEAAFRRRLNRFSALVEIGSNSEVAHLPNSGRLEECLRPGTVVHLARRASPRRSTAYDLALAVAGEALVSVDARLPPALVAEAFSRGMLAPFSSYTGIRREVKWEDCRLDLSFSSTERTAIVEVKSVTLVRRGCALFPDAPTLRGQRHVAALARALKQGYEAAVIFVVQRPDALSFRPNAETDPAFAHALRQASAQGVRCYAYTCQVSTHDVTLHQGIPVFL